MMKQYSVPTWRRALPQQEARDVGTPSGRKVFISTHVEVSDTHIRFILGLKDITSNGLLLDSLNECLEHQLYEYSIRVTYKHGYYFFV